jgi:hypothetical protein
VYRVVTLTAKTEVWIATTGITTTSNNSINVKRWRIQRKRKRGTSRSTSFQSKGLYGSNGKGS